MIQGAGCSTAVIEQDGVRRAVLVVVKYDYCVPSGMLLRSRSSLSPDVQSAMASLDPPLVDDIRKYAVMWAIWS